MTANRVIKGDRCAPSSTQGTIAVGEPLKVDFVPTGGSTPQIECIKEGEIVRRINVRCGCGQVLTLVCSYADGSE